MNHKIEEQRNALKNVITGLQSLYDQGWVIDNVNMKYHYEPYYSQSWQALPLVDPGICVEKDIHLKLTKVK